MKPPRNVLLQRPKTTINAAGNNAVTIVENEKMGTVYKGKVPLH